MAGFDPAFYGDRWADVYDEHHAEMDPAAVDVLAGLPGDGRVLELAIGTGRVALPLAGRGIAVEGIDASALMVDQLRAKPGGESIPVVIGDMAQVPASGPFRLVYLVFITLFGLLDQARQAECFRNSPACSTRAACLSSNASFPIPPGSTGASASTPER
jgi:SAM-dependent methyltransferase